MASKSSGKTGAAGKAARGGKRARAGKSAAAAGTPTAAGRVKIQWVRSWIGCTEDQRATVRGLGLRRLRQVVERPDTPAVRGMVKKIPHLVQVVEE